MSEGNALLQPGLSPAAMVGLALTAILLCGTFGASIFVLWRRARRADPRARPARRVPRLGAAALRTDIEKGGDGAAEDLKGAGEGPFKHVDSPDADLVLPRLFKLQAADGQCLGLEISVTPPTPQPVGPRRVRFNSVSETQRVGDPSWWGV